MKLLRAAFRTGPAFEADGWATDLSIVFGETREGSGARATERMDVTAAGALTCPRRFRDSAAAVRWFKKSADQGHAIGEYNLGVMYWHGAGVPRDFQKAANWFQRAAQQGYARAQLILGLQYRDGLGVQQDYQLAAAWLGKAARQGNSDAQNKLGILYLEGQGMTADDEQAAAFFAKAAEQGHSQAQANLATLYKGGRGVPRDLVQAYKWYQLAQHGDRVDRSDRLRELANSMSSEQVADAERMVTEWRLAQDSHKAEDGESMADLLE